MPIEAVSWALRLRKTKTIDDSALRTLAVLADHANGDSMAWPSWDTLADERGVHRATIARHLKALFAEGLILPGDERYVSHLPSKYRPKVWMVNWPGAPRAMPAVASVRPLPLDVASGATPEPSRGRKSDHLEVASGATQNPHRTSSDSYVPKSPPRAREGEQAWEDWPDVECAHGYDCLTLVVKRTGERIPKCAECRRAGYYVLPNTPAQEAS